MVSWNFFRKKPAVGHVAAVDAPGLENGVPSMATTGRKGPKPPYSIDTAFGNIGLYTFKKKSMIKVSLPFLKAPHFEG
jgi:hypothetical protein